MSWRKKAELDKTDDPRTYKLVKKHTDLRCPICPPHKHENASRKPKHGTKKPKYKNNP